MQVKFSIPGEPKGKARARTWQDQKTGRSVTKTPEGTVMYENLVKLCYQSAAKGFSFPKGTPVSMKIVARFGIPKGVSNKMRSLMEAGFIRPMKKPDKDNIDKIVTDALNKVAYYDDAGIVHSEIDKVYTSGQPCVDVVLKEWEAVKDG